ncbi:uncharacterized protein LOC132645658 [Lycium barbarum]|uniref:uncharacterized protein LOC132645658 n=1 Tax=Lycium barbarum TaxID=112863 RepID=UPI00293EC87B|nr:uncharacterized protein LOC132645658 [Lycium barbarum]XP_060218750.1 uncharacterized protein LOC132645658 [Lycium barbarum]
MGVQLQHWQERLGTLAVVGHATPIMDYLHWYHGITRRLIENPTLHLARDVGYAALAGQYEALLVAVHRLYILGLKHMSNPGVAGFAAEMVRISEGGIRQAGEVRRMDDPVLEGEYQAARGGRRGAARGRSAAKRPGRGEHHLVDEVAPIPEVVPILVLPQPFQASGSSVGPSPMFTSARLLAKIPGSSSQPSQNAYTKERDDIDWAAFRASLDDEWPVRNLDGPSILDFDGFLIPDSVPVDPPEQPTQAFSRMSAEPEVSSHETVKPQDSASVGPPVRSTQAFSHGLAEP